MTTYRVGAAGATVFDAEGRVVARLLPGTIVVEGTIEAANTPAANRDAARARGKRIRDYADKRLAAACAYEDKGRG